jgi:Domain of unknown function (DUF4190)/Domain of unknown function (DUF1707)
VTSDPEPGSDEAPPPPTTPLTTPVYGPPSYGPVHYGPVGYGPQHGFGPQAYPGQGQNLQQPGMLCAAADRERTMDVLKAAFTEGRLTKSEFDERAARVLSARTYADLNALVADLPVGPGAPMMVMPYLPGYYPPVPVPRTNGFAIGALVCGIVPFFGGIPAVIFGHVARGQIRRTGERGDGMAVAGLVLGYLWLSLWTLVILVGMARG